MIRVLIVIIMHSFLTNYILDTVFNTCSCDVKNLNNLLCRLAADSILLSSWARESNHQILILTLPHFPKNKLFMKYFGIKISSFDWKLWSFVCAHCFFFWWRSWGTWLAANFPPKHAYYIYWLPSRTQKVYRWSTGIINLCSSCMKVNGDQEMF